MRFSFFFISQQLQLDCIFNWGRMEMKAKKLIVVCAIFFCGGAYFSNYVLGLLEKIVSIIKKSPCCWIKKRAPSWLREVSTQEGQCSLARGRAWIPHYITTINITFLNVRFLGPVALNTIQIIEREQKHVNVTTFKKPKKIVYHPFNAIVD